MISSDSTAVLPDGGFFFFLSFLCAGPTQYRTAVCYGSEPSGSDWLSAVEIAKEVREIGQRNRRWRLKKEAGGCCNRFEAKVEAKFSR